MSLQLSGGTTGSSQPVSYAAFVLVFQNSDYLHKKVDRIVQSFSLCSHEMPKGQSDSDRKDQISEIETQITNQEELYRQTKARLHDYLASV